VRRATTNVLLGRARQLVEARLVLLAHLENLRGLVVVELGELGLDIASKEDRRDRHHECPHLVTPAPHRRMAGNRNHAV